MVDIPFSLSFGEVRERVPREQGLKLGNLAGDGTATLKSESEFHENKD